MLYNRFKVNNKYNLKICHNPEWMEVFSLHKAPNRSTTAVVGYQSNQKLLHHYQHAKNELNLLIHS